jgi:hypothetical protein
MIKHIIDILQKKTTLRKRRSKHWRKLRKKHLQKNPYCYLCGNKKHLEVHHINPFHLRPDLELEPTNLITLCDKKSKVYIGSCHRVIGHKGSWRRKNDNLYADIYAVQKIFNKR